MTWQNSQNKEKLKQHKKNQHTQKHNRKQPATLVDPARKWGGLLYTGPRTIMGQATTNCHFLVIINRTTHNLCQQAEGCDHSFCLCVIL